MWNCDKSKIAKRAHEDNHSTKVAMGSLYYFCLILIIKFVKVFVLQLDVSSCGLTGTAAPCHACVHPTGAQQNIYNYAGGGVLNRYAHPPAGATIIYERSGSQHVQ